MQVELLDVFGDDNMVVQAARVSYKKEASQYTEAQNVRLIKFLAEHQHKAPFYHPQLQFRIKCPIYVERQLFKHTIGISVNSVSGRYVDFSDSYDRIGYGEWRLQSTDSKQGSAGPASDLAQAACNELQEQVIRVCSDAYSKMIEHGISKEQARSILPLNLETEFVWTGSLYALINMCFLRLKPDAQKETRQVVEKMLDLARQTQKFKYSFDAFKL